MTRRDIGAATKRHTGDILQALAATKLGGLNLVTPAVVLSEAASCRAAVARILATQHASHVLLVRQKLSCMLLRS